MSNASSYWHVPKCFGVLLISFFSYGQCLNIFVDHYEKLSYAPVSSGRRVRRSADGLADPLSIRFRSHDRDFHLILFNIDGENDVFHPRHLLDVDQKLFSDLRPHEFLFRGHVEGEQSSTVFGSILDGIFDGHIQLHNGQSFTVEKAVKYFNSSHGKHSFHSIIYTDTDINEDKLRRKRFSGNMVENDHVGCGLNDLEHMRMDKIQQSSGFLHTGHSTWFDHPPNADSRHSFPNRYISDRVKRELSNGDSDEYDVISGRRLYKVRTCSLYLQADQKLYNQIKSKEGNDDPVRTREEIMGLFYNHIKAVNQIYEASNFGGVTGLNFVIQRSSILTEESCRQDTEQGNPFCRENVDVANYLNLNSERNHSSFCLAYALTYRDFIGGTLGLAWVASPNKNTAGGVCQVYQRYNEGSRGWIYRSLNTGIITLVNYGNRVPTRVSQLTLAHEIGHNFGSPHDYPAECQPGLPDGNYIMFASATSGDKSNNAKFSKCSVHNITSVLYEVLQQTPVDPQKQLSSGNGHGKRNCFQRRTSAFCGNQIYEPTGDADTEECDCGFTQKDCLLMGDPCCLPPEIDGHLDQKAACHINRRSRNIYNRPYICSPSNGPCCDNTTCDYYKSVRKHLCRRESDCEQRQFCNGLQSQCPPSTNKPNGLPCQDSTKVCHAGNCNGSICEQIGYKDCFLTVGSAEKLCHLACKVGAKCVSSFELNQFNPKSRESYIYSQQGREKELGLLLRPGSPCNDYKGYCDIFRKCRSVDSNGPLARLKNILFNKETINSLSDWIEVGI